MRYVGLVLLLTSVAGALFFSCDSLSRRSHDSLTDPEDGATEGDI